MVSAKKDSAPHPVDVHVGSRVRLRRTYLGYSQDRVAKALGVTFQQVQKYEKGSNRISSSKLFEIAMLLDVPPAFFFNGAENAIGIASAKTSQAGKAAPSDQSSSMDDPMLSRREALNIVMHYYAIPDKDLRRGVLALIKALAKPANN